MRARLAVAAALAAAVAVPFLATAQQTATGAAMVYERDGTVYLSGVGSGVEIPFTQGVAPALSGNAIALVRPSGGAAQAFVRRLDGSETQVTKLPDREAEFGAGRYGVTGSAWSPQRTWLALRLMEGSTTTLAVVRPDGTGFLRYEFGHLFGSAIAWRDETTLAVGTDEGLRLVVAGGAASPVTGAVSGDTPVCWLDPERLVVNTVTGIATLNVTTGARRDVLADAVGWDLLGSRVLYTTDRVVGAVDLDGAAPAPIADLPNGGQVLAASGVTGEPVLEISDGADNGIWTTEPTVDNGGGATVFARQATTLRRIATGTSLTVSIGSEVPADLTQGATQPATAAAPRAAAHLLDHAPGPVDPPPGRSTFSHALPAADEVSTDGGAVVVNLLVTMALMLLITFPSELFNKTLEEHYDEVRGWFRLPPRRPAVERPRRARLVMFAAYVGIAAVLYTLLDPNAGLDGTTARLWLGLAVGLAVVTLLFGFGHVAYHRRRHERGFLNVLPGTLAVGVACVVVSRATSFEPGYLYGIVGGFAFAAAMSERDEGRAELVAAGWVLVAALVAWLLWQPVNHSADRGHPSLVVGLLDTTLSAIAVGGLQGLVLGLLPLRSLPGHKVWRWDKRAWGVAYGVVMFVFVHVLLHPASGFGAEAHADAFFTWLALFVGFGVVSVAFWAYFQRRPEPVSSG